MMGLKSKDQEIKRRRAVLIMRREHIVQEWKGRDSKTTEILHIEQHVFPDITDADY
jgi:hypothetical protein